MNAKAQRRKDAKSDTKLARPIGRERQTPSWAERRGHRSTHAVLGEQGHLVFSFYLAPLRPGVFAFPSGPTEAPAAIPGRVTAWRTKLHWALERLGNGAWPLLRTSRARFKTPLCCPLL